MREATDATRAANQAVAAALPLDDPDDFTRASRGHMAAPPGAVLNAWGFPVWNLEDFAFVDGTAPGTVNPSLWRQAQLNNHGGLFEVADGIYQVRGFDLSNMTFVATDSGRIVIDPLTSAETARAAMTLVCTSIVDPRPVRAVIYTHSHVDHFGGVRGVVDEADVASGHGPIIAPEGFLEAAISENVLAGNAMIRRATYMYGALLPPDRHGHVDAGLGKGVPLLGTSGLLAPTEQIADDRRRARDRRRAHRVPGHARHRGAGRDELLLPRRPRAVHGRELHAHNLHNLYTPARRAGARRAGVEQVHRRGDRAVRASGRRAVRAAPLAAAWGARRASSTCATPARRLPLPARPDAAPRQPRPHDDRDRRGVDAAPSAGATSSAVRGYYGTVNHNVKAIYQRYLGWFDGNPAHPPPAPADEAGRRYVEFMGGADAVLRQGARESFDQGDYRWVAEVVNHVVFAEPDNAAALQLQADTFEQLGYQAESGPWRGFYLTGGPGAAQRHRGTRIRWPRQP